jgi:toxin ParE1/3/4
MKNKFDVSPAAGEDVRGQTSRIEEDNPGAAFRFVEAFDRACELLAKHPEMAPIHDFGKPELSGLRMWPIRGFEKHLLFYRPTSEGIEVVREFAGHSDIRTTELYFARKVEDAEVAARRIQIRMAPGKHGPGGD